MRYSVHVWSLGVSTFVWYQCWPPATVTSTFWPRGHRAAWGLLFHMHILFFRVSEIIETDIAWVLTVPAIWNDGAKQFMREAAEMVSYQFFSCKIFMSNSVIVQRMHITLCCADFNLFFCHLISSVCLPTWLSVHLPMSFCPSTTSFMLVGLSKWNLHYLSTLLLIALFITGT